MKIKLEYEALLKSGMFYEFFPMLSGEWKKDKKSFIKQLKHFRKPKN